ncbi:MAG: FAD-binding protein [Rhodobacteraceae bacterium]|nr:FAD-binding protein [Paracoccaceae bacterium]
MKPSNEQELAAMVANATGPLNIVGGGTWQARNNAKQLYTSGLSGVTLYEPEALTLVAKSGTPLLEIEALLAKNGQCLPFEPNDLGALHGVKSTPTIGGVVATNASGPRRISAGACRDSLIGVRFVDGNGTIIKNGGRVMKNVTGYDLVKLMSGSFGTLGVLTEVSFKLLPAAQASASVLISEDEKTCAATMARALGSPYDVNGAAHVDGITAVRISGLAGSVEYRAAALAKLLGGKIGEFDWQGLRDVRAFADQDGDVWRFSVKPSDGPELAANLRSLGASKIMFDWAGGLLWVLAPGGLNMRAAKYTGHAMLMRGDALPVFQPQPAPIAALAKGLRAKFDPRNILNPDRMT